MGFVRQTVITMADKMAAASRSVRTCGHSYLVLYLLSYEILYMNYFYQTLTQGRRTQLQRNKQQCRFLTLLQRQNQ